MGELGTLFRSCLFWFSVSGGTCRQGCETAPIDTFGGRKLEIFKRGHLLICKTNPQGKYSLVLIPAADSGATIAHTSFGLLVKFKIKINIKLKYFQKIAIYQVKRYHDINIY